MDSIVPDGHPDRSSPCGDILPGLTRPDRQRVQPTWNVIGAGGGNGASTGSGFSVVGTLGQVAIHSTQGSGFKVAQGFWVQFKTIMKLFLPFIRRAWPSSHVETPKTWRGSAPTGGFSRDILNNAMNDRRPFQYLVPSLLIFLTLVALAASTVFTFTVGAPPPTLTASPTHLAGTVVTPGPEPTPDYSDQAQITDGIVVFGVIVVSIILFGIAWGIRLTNRRSSPPSRKV